MFYEKISPKCLLLGWLDGGWVSCITRSFKRNAHFCVGLRVGFVFYERLLANWAVHLSFVLVLEFDPTHVSNKALSDIHTVGSCFLRLGFVFYEKLYARYTLLGFLF